MNLNDEIVIFIKGFHVQVTLRHYDLHRSIDDPKLKVLIHSIIISVNLYNLT